MFAITNDTEETATTDAATEGADERLSRGRVPAVDRAVRILNLLASEPDRGLGVSEVSRHLDLNKSTVHAILATLCDHGFVERDPRSRSYRPGPALDVLAASLRREPGITVLARPALEALLNEFGETVFLAVFREEHIVLVDKEESHLDMSITSPLGRRLPHSAGALGKVFHAWMAEGELRTLLRRRPLRAYTDRTIVDRAAYLEEVRLVRKAGVAFDHEEYLQSVRAAAAPIFDARSEVSAALCVVGPGARLGRRKLRAVGQRTRELARSISTRMGADRARWPEAAVR